MRCDSRASLLARNLASPCFGREPKARVTTFTIFYQWWSSISLGIWTIVTKKRRNFGTLWKLVGCFCQKFLLIFFFILRWCYNIFQGRCNKKKNNIFCCLNFRRHIIKFCNHYCCCKTFEFFLLHHPTRSISHTSLWVVDDPRPIIACQHDSSPSHYWYSHSQYTLQVIQHK